MVFALYKHPGASCDAAGLDRSPGQQTRTYSFATGPGGKAFHLAFIVSCDPCIVFKIMKRTIFSPAGLVVELPPLAAPSF